MPNLLLLSLNFLSLFILFQAEAFGTALKVGVSPVTSSAAIFIAKEKGYFSKHGLDDVELIIFKNSGAPMTPLLASGELDIGGGNISAGLFNSFNQGLGLKIVADKGHINQNCDYINLIVRSDLVDSKKYQSPKDLKGMRVGVTSDTGVSQQILLDRILKKSGLSYKDLVFVKMSYSAMNLALQMKEIDATIQLEPFVTMATKSGIAKKVESGFAHYPNQQSAAIIFSSKLMTTHRDQGIKFLAAYLEGIKDYNEAFLAQKNKIEVINLLKKYIAIDGPDVWEHMSPVGLDSNGKVNLESLSSDLLWYQANNFIEKPITVEKIIDHSLVNEAQKLLKR